MTDRFRRAADRGRRAAARPGVEQRPVTVTIRVQVYSGAIGAQGVTLSSTTDLVLSPSPKVEKLTAENAAWYGGGAASAATGALKLDVYRVGPVTKAFAGGGYTLAQLTPAGGFDRRSLVILSGEGFPDGGEVFEVVDTDEHTHPQSIYLTVRRTKQ